MSSSVRRRSAVCNRGRWRSRCVRCSSVSSGACRNTTTPRSCRIFRLSGDRTTPPPVASTRLDWRVSSSRTDDSRLRKPASPSISKMSGIPCSAARKDGVRWWIFPPPSDRSGRYCPAGSWRRYASIPAINQANRPSSGGRLWQQQCLTQTEVFRENPGCQENQQLGLVVLGFLALEQPAQQRNISKKRDLGDSINLVLFVDAADDHGLAVVEQHLGFDLLHVQHAGDGIGKVVLGDVHFHVNAVIRRDLRRDFQLERGLLGHHGADTQHAGRESPLLTLLDTRQFLVGGDDARAGNDLALAFLLQRRQLQVQQAAVRADLGNGDADGAGDGAANTGGRQIDIKTA